QLQRPGFHQTQAHLSKQSEQRAGNQRAVLARVGPEVSRDPPEVWQIITELSGWSHYCAACFPPAGGVWTGSRSSFCRKRLSKTFAEGDGGTKAFLPAKLSRWLAARRAPSKLKTFCARSSNCCRGV